MPHVTIRRPLGELDLGDQLRFQPHAVFHLFPGQSPLGPLPQVGERAGVDLQPLELARHLTPDKRHKPVSHLGSVQKPLALVIADYQRIKRIPRRVAADDKLLPPVDLVFDPCAGSCRGPLTLSGFNPQGQTMCLCLESRNACIAAESKSFIPVLYLNTNLI